MLWIFGIFTGFYFFFKVYSKKIVAKKAEQWIKSGGIIIDVRSREEFSQGSVHQSKNIPLSELERNLNKFDVHQFIIVCCASGMRSKMAKNILNQNGFKSVMNAGSWKNLNFQKK